MYEQWNWGTKNDIKYKEQNSTNKWDEVYIN